MTTCAVWVMAQAPQSAQENEDVIPEWLFASGEEEDDVTRIISTRKPKPGLVKGGTSCLNTDECGQGKCCLRRSKSPRRRCRRFQRIGERCTEEQMMGGYYYGHCPCNKNGVCTYTDKGLRCVKKKKEPEQELPLPPVPTQPPPLSPILPPKQDSQESGENQGKPGGPAKPPKEENELPELPFESLTGPNENNNAITPFFPGGTGNRPDRPSNKPVATEPGATSTHGFPPSTATTNPTGNGGLGNNEVVPGGTTPEQNSTGPAGPFANPPFGRPPFQSPQASSPPASTQGSPMLPPLQSPTSPGNNNLLHPGSQPSPLPQPPLSTGNSNFPPTNNQELGPSGPPMSPPANGNPPMVEQKPSQLPSSSSPTTPAAENSLPPHADSGPPPPPLPPSPFDVMNGRSRA